MDLTLDERWIATLQARSRSGEIHLDDVLQEMLLNKISGTYPGRVFSFVRDGSWLALPVHGGRENKKVIPLNHFELLVCKYLGPRRTKAARAAGMVNMIQSGKSGSKDEAFAEANGLCGELAYGIRQNLYPHDQLTIKARACSEDCGDYVEKVNETVLSTDIKTSHYPTGCLTLSPWKIGETFLQRVQMLGLMIGDCREGGDFRFAGYYPAKAAIKRKPGYLRGRDKPQLIFQQWELIPDLHSACKYL
jgi:hypothetical protein